MNSMKLKLAISTKQRITFFAIFMFITCQLFGCTVAGPVGISMGVGAAYLNKERANIYVTENESDIKSCEFVKHVKANTYWGGLAFQDKALEKTISDLTHDSAESGANVLLIRSKSKTFNGSSSEGDAYQCPDSPNNPAKRQISGKQ